MPIQLHDCPKCKTKHGWWEKRQQSYEQYYLPDGTSSHATDGNSVGRGGVRKFCFECNRDISDLIGEESGTMETT